MDRRRGPQCEGGEGGVGLATAAGARPPSREHEDVARAAGMSLAEVAVLARHANARVTGQLYAGLSDKAKAGLASKLVASGIGS